MAAKTKSEKLRTEHDELHLRDGALTIVVVADTHGHPHPRSAELIAAERPDRILHAGDIGDLKVLDGLAQIAPVSAVRGNIDGHGEAIPDVRVLDIRDGERTLLKVLLMHIAVNGPRIRADALRLARAEDTSLVVCGHSHVPFMGRDRDVVLFNPGSIGPRRFQLPILFGVIDIKPTGVKMKHIDCESGNPWLP